MLRGYLILPTTEARPADDGCAHSIVAVRVSPRFTKKITILAFCLVFEVCFLTGGFTITQHSKGFSPFHPPIEWGGGSRKRCESFMHDEKK